MGHASWKGRVQQRPRFKGWRWAGRRGASRSNRGRMCSRTKYNGAVLAHVGVEVGRWPPSKRECSCARVSGEKHLRWTERHVWKRHRKAEQARDQEGDPKVKIEQFHQIVKEAIRSHSSPGIDRSDAHGCRGQAAYHVVDNHVGFIAHAIAKAIGEEQIKLVICRGCSLSGEVHRVRRGRDLRGLRRLGAAHGRDRRGLGAAHPEAAELARARTRSSTCRRTTSCPTTSSPATPSASARWCGAPDCEEARGA